MDTHALIKTAVGAAVSFSYILVGNGVTQSYMAVPALMLDFPSPGSPDHSARAKLLGRQWPIFWAVGNSFFRPISTFGIIGYGAAAIYLYRQGEEVQADWRLFAISSLLHLVTVVHSAMNMQPINNKLEALATKASEKELMDAWNLADQWRRWNKVRLFNAAIAGTLALTQIFKL